jgi:hypothetical protein
MVPLSAFGALGVLGCCCHHHHHHHHVPPLPGPVAPPALVDLDLVRVGSWLLFVVVGCLLVPVFTYSLLIPIAGCYCYYI